MKENTTDILSTFITIKIPFFFLILSLFGLMWHFVIIWLYSGHSVLVLCAICLWLFTQMANYFGLAIYKVLWITMCVPFRFWLTLTLKIIEITGNTFYLPMQILLLENCRIRKFKELLWLYIIIWYALLQK